MTAWIFAAAEVAADLMPDAADVFRFVASRLRPEFGLADGFRAFPPAAVTMSDGSAVPPVAEAVVVAVGDSAVDAGSPGTLFALFPRLLEAFLDLCLVTPVGPPCAPSSPTALATASPFVLVGFELPAEAALCPPRPLPCLLDSAPFAPLVSPAPASLTDGPPTLPPFEPFDRSLPFDPSLAALLLRALFDDDGLEGGLLVVPAGGAGGASVLVAVEAVTD
jgi:hypothetical protein